jgi:hypothetical protein
LNAASHSARIAPQVVQQQNLESEKLPGRRTVADHQRSAAIYPSGPPTCKTGRL